MRCAHYGFDEGSGSVALDGSGNGNDGTLIGGPVRVAGTSGGALQFTSAATYVSVPNNASLNISGTELTVSVQPAASSGQVTPRATAPLASLLLSPPGGARNREEEVIQCE